MILFTVRCLICSAAVQSREVMNHWCEKEWKIWGQLLLKINETLHLASWALIVCVDFDKIFSKFLRRILLAMSFGLSKKAQNLNQYTLLSNVEGKMFKSNEGFVAFACIQLTVSNYILCFSLLDYVEQLKATTDSIKDDSIPLQYFCATFEQILLEGAKSTNLYFVFMSHRLKRSESSKRIKNL